VPHVFSTGTNLVVGLDNRLILKIFPPMLRAQFVSERGSLSQLRGRLRVPIPEIVHEGARDGWPYLIITRLQGVEGAAAWASLPQEDKARVLGEIGETIAGCSASRPADCLRSSRVGTVLCAGRSKGAGQGISGSAWRRSSWTDSTICCAMRAN
jgi:hypothetical protein